MKSVAAPAAMTSLSATTSIAAVTERIPLTGAGDEGPKCPA